MIDKNVHYFTILDKINFFVPHIMVDVSNTDNMWVECELAESLFDNYKVTLTPIDLMDKFTYMQKNIYISEFNQQLANGIIVPKYGKEYIAKEVECNPIGCGLYIQTERYFINTK